MDSSFDKFSAAMRIFRGGPQVSIKTVAEQQALVRRRHTFCDTDFQPSRSARRLLVLVWNSVTGWKGCAKKSYVCIILR